MESTIASRSSDLPDDPLSQVLALLRPHGTVSGAFDVAGDWAVEFGPHEGVKFQAVITGGFWLRVEGIADPIRVQAGDCFLLPRGRPFTMASDLSLKPLDAHTFLEAPLRGGVRRFNGGGDCYSFGCFFGFSGRHAEILLGMLPPIVHIRAEADKVAMRWFVERMMLELREPQPGSLLVARQLATLLLVQALRLQLADGLDRGAGVGWLFALSDQQMRAAIGAIHGDPARRWTLRSLAERACMSRSSFALRFRRSVGSTPMEYLTRWRMLLAADRLVEQNEPVAAISRSLGYESGTAFTTAFRRVMGCSPRDYAGRHAAGAAGQGNP